MIKNSQIARICFDVFAVGLSLVCWNSWIPGRLHWGHVGCASVLQKFQEQIHLRDEFTHGGHVDLWRHLQNYLLCTQTYSSAVLHLWLPPGRETKYKNLQVTSITEGNCGYPDPGPGLDVQTQHWEEEEVRAGATIVTGGGGAGGRGRHLHPLVSGSSGGGGGHGDCLGGFHSWHRGQEIEIRITTNDIFKRGLYEIAI